MNLKLSSLNKATCVAISLCVGIASFSPAGLADQPSRKSQIVKSNVNVASTTYLLGPGDVLQVEILDVPELSGNYAIGPDGTMYLPRVRALYVEGLTVEELRYFLSQQFSFFVKNPQLFVRPIEYRPIRIYVGGEVLRPGYYTLRGQDSSKLISGESTPLNSTTVIAGGSSRSSMPIMKAPAVLADSSKLSFPTVFDAIRSAQGISPYANLSAVEVTRKQSLGSGGGRIRAVINLMSLINNGDESQNIRLFDGDVVNVGKSSTLLSDQLVKAGRTNLSPQYIEVYISGRVRTPGTISMQQGTTLNQAISVAGGVKLLRGKVQFLRFLGDGKTDQRNFHYAPTAPSNSFPNPILAAGDVIRVNDSAFSAGVEALGEVTAPLLGIYSIYGITQGAFR